MLEMWKNRKASAFRIEDLKKNQIEILELKDAVTERISSGIELTEWRGNRRNRWLGAEMLLNLNKRENRY